LPPVWVDIQESIDEKIEEMDKKFDQLSKLRIQRFKPKFNDDENLSLDREIDTLVSELVTTIKKIEKELKEMMID